MNEKESQRREYEMRRRTFALNSFRAHSEAVLRVIGLAIAGNLAGAAFIFSALKGAKAAVGTEIALASFVLGGVIAVPAIMFELNGSAVETAKQINAARRNFPAALDFVRAHSVFRLLLSAF